MRRHDAGQPGADQRAVRHQVVRLDRREIPVVHRHLVMRVGAHVAVPGEVLSDRAHAHSPHAAGERPGELRYRGRLGVERPVADHARRAEIDVQHRREAEVHAVRRKLRRKHDPDRARQVLGERRVVVVDPAERAHRRQPGEAVREPLHPAPLVIDSDEKRRRPDAVDSAGQRLQLPG